MGEYADRLDVLDVIVAAALLALYAGAFMLLRPDRVCVLYGEDPKGEA